MSSKYGVGAENRGDGAYRNRSYKHPWMGLVVRGSSDSDRVHKLVPVIERPIAARAIGPRGV